MRIALAQTPGVTLAEWRETLARFESALRSAADQGSDLVLLPECFWPAYFLSSAEAFHAARAAGMPGHDEFLRLVADRARQHRLAICVGYVEESDAGLLNSAAFVERDGRVAGVHRKCFLWDFDRRWFAPGESIRPFDTEFGPVGIMICADNRMPEIPGTLAARGARLILQPTAWVNGGTAAEPWSPQVDFLVEARAREFGVTIASCSKWGEEGGTAFVGSSMICDAEGRRRVQAPAAETVVVSAEVELSAPRAAPLGAALRAALEAGPAPGGESLPPVCALLAEPRGVRVVFSESAAAPGTIGGRSHRIEPPTAALNGALPTLEVVDGVGFAALRAASLRSYAVPRAASLAGAHVLVAFGDDVPTACLKARAAENRVYVVHVNGQQCRGYDVTGRPLAAEQSAGGVPLFRLEPPRAATKEIAWRTDVFRDRRPAAYEFAAPAACGA